MIEGDPLPQICEDCVVHQVAEPEESDRVRLVRSEDHLRRVREWNVLIREKNEEMHQEKQAAFRTRNTWRRALVELKLAHGVNESVNHRDRLVAPAILRADELLQPCGVRTRTHMPGLDSDVANLPRRSVRSEVRVTVAAAVGSSSGYCLCPFWERPDDRWQPGGL
jgi:hypothetical protein